MKIKMIVLSVSLLATGLLFAQAPGSDHDGATKQVCQLISANPPDFNPFQFVPKNVTLTGLNRSPKVTYVVTEDGTVGKVKILKGTGSPKVDAGLVKSIQAWKYKAQPGCAFEMTTSVIIEIAAAR